MAKYKAIESVKAFFPIVYQKQGVWAPVFWGDGPILLDSVQWESSGFSRDNSVSNDNGAVILRMPVLVVTAVSATAFAQGWRVGDYAAVDSVGMPGYGLGAFLRINIADAGPQFDSYNRQPVVAVKVVPLDAVATVPAGASAAATAANTANSTVVYPPAYQGNGYPPVVYSPAPAPQGLDLNTILALSDRERESREAREERQAQRDERADERQAQRDERAQERRDRLDEQRRQERLAQLQRGGRKRQMPKDPEDDDDEYDDEEDEEYDDDLI